jgi:hypothetical protein
MPSTTLSNRISPRGPTTVSSPRAASSSTTMDC